MAGISSRNLQNLVCVLPLRRDEDASGERPPSGDPQPPGRVFSPASAALFQVRFDDLGRAL